MTTAEFKPRLIDRPTKALLFLGGILILFGLAFYLIYINGFILMTILFIINLLFLLLYLVIHLSKKAKIENDTLFLYHKILYIGPWAVQTFILQNIASLKFTGRLSSSTGAASGASSYDPIFEIGFKDGTIERLSAIGWNFEPVNEMFQQIKENFPNLRIKVNELNSPYDWISKLIH